MSKKHKTDYKMPVLIVVFVAVLIIGFNVYLQYTATEKSAGIGSVEIDSVSEIEKAAEISPSEKKHMFFTLAEKSSKFQKSPELKSESGSVEIKYSAKNVNIVASGNGTLSIFLDGKKISESESGRDVKESEIKINRKGLYSMVSSSYGTHSLKLVAEGDFRIFTFTFG